MRMDRRSSLSKIRIFQITVYCQHIINISGSMQLANYFNTGFICEKIYGLASDLCAVSVFVIVELKTAFDT
jgi:hypothetical protein